LIKVTNNMFRLIKLPILQFLTHNENYFGCHRRGARPASQVSQNRFGHLGLNNNLSLSTMTEADFTKIEEICRSEFQNLWLAETDFYDYYTENVVVTLRLAHKRLLNGIKFMGIKLWTKNTIKNTS
jgi:hypothetical protein